MEYYNALGIEKSADSSSIKKAYRKLAMKYHPDKNPGNKQAEEKFKLVNEAYSVLSDPEQRRVYDSFGKDGLKGGGQRAQDINPQDIFNDLFGGAFFKSNARHRRRQPGISTSIHVEVEVGLEDLIFGKSIVIKYPRQFKCHDCNGEGGEYSVCPACHGTGQVNFTRGFMNLTTTCTTCHGHGKILQKACSTCNGRKTISSNEETEIEIPPGMRPDQQLKFHGLGNRDVSDSPGDLLVSFRLRESKFHLNGTNIYTDVEVDCIEACLGCETKVKTLDGEKTIDIPPGIQHSQKIKLQGLGFPAMINSSVRGDLFMNVKIKVPKIFSQDERQALNFVKESRKNARSF